MKSTYVWRRCFLFLFVEIVSVKEGEKNAITVTSVDNSESANEYHDCQDTLDKVYLLSYNEAMEESYGFLMNIFTDDYDYAKIAQPTSFAVNNGALCSDSEMFTANNCWWTRTTIFGDDNIYSGNAMVGINGRIGFGYKTCDTAAWGVRPVLHMDISKETVWKKAGKVVVTNKIENDEATTEQITTKTVEPTTVQTTTKLVKKQSR